MFLIEYSSTRTAKEAWVIQRIGIVRDHKMILKILASDNPPDQHVQGLLNGAAFQNHQDLPSLNGRSQAHETRGTRR